MIAKNLFNLAIRGTLSRTMMTVSSQFSFSNEKSQAELLEVVEGKVFEILRSAAKCDQSKLSKTATFEQLGFDSLDSVELVVAMEENFGLDIPNEEAEKISTVQAAINTFYRHLNEKANKIEEQWLNLFVCLQILTGFSQRICLN